MIEWGDIIDGAQFASPEEAVGLAEPAMQLALVIEAAPEPNLVPRLIPDLAYMPLREDDRTAAHQEALGTVARTAPAVDRNLCASAPILAGGVVYFDVSDLDLEGYNKFIPYLSVSGTPSIRWA